MADFTPPPGFERAGAAAGGFKPPPGFEPMTPPAGFERTDAPPAAPAPSTTAGGVAGSITRGLAPIAAGAGIGAAMGAPFAGVGAVPGAIAGGIAAGGADIAGSLYNLGARTVGKPSAQVATPSDLTTRLADYLGIKAPSTSLERAAEMGAGFAAGAVPGLKAFVPPLATTLAEGKAGVAEKYIHNLYTRSIKPSTTGRDTLGQRRSAFSEIVESKPELKYLDAEGKVVSEGHLPQTIEQFGQAIDHTKDKLFRQWDALAEQAGAAGAKVDTANVVRELRKKAADPVLIRQSPETAYHAAEMANRYEAAGSLLPSEAQREITAWNQRLKAYYKSQHPADTAAADMHEIIANNLRKGLDSTIEKTVAPGYQELKLRYGALSAIEKDVDRAAKRVSNREPGGGIMGRIANPLALGELAHGIIGQSPRDLLAAGAIKGGQMIMRHRADPNNTIKRMFETAEKYHKAPPGSFAEDVIPPAGPAFGPTVSTGPQPPRPTGPGQQIVGQMRPETTVPRGGGSSVPAPPRPVDPLRSVIESRYPPASDFSTVPIGGGRNF